MVHTEVCRSSRLRIRRWVDDDIPRLFEIYSDPKVTRFLPDIHVTHRDEIVARHPKLMASYVRYGLGYGVWAAERLDTGHVVGTVMLKHLPGLEHQLTDDVEVGWHLGSDSWGQGYATEMARAVVAYGFHTQKLERIYAIAHLENDASFAVMRRLGMKRLGPNQIYYDGEKADVYAIDRQDWVSLAS